MAIKPYRKCVSGVDTAVYDCATDLSGLEFTAVELSVDRKVSAYSSGVVVGILMNRPSNTGTAGEMSFEAIVQESGHALWKNTGAVAAGQLVTVTTGGVCTVSTPTNKDKVYGVCIVGAATGLNATIKLFPRCVENV